MIVRAEHQFFTTLFLFRRDTLIDGTVSFRKRFWMILILFMNTLPLFQMFSLHVCVCVFERLSGTEARWIDDKTRSRKHCTAKSWRLLSPESGVLSLTRTHTYIHSHTRARVCTYTHVCNTPRYSSTNSRTVGRKVEDSILVFEFLHTQTHKCARVHTHTHTHKCHARTARIAPTNSSRETRTTG